MRAERQVLCVLLAPLETPWLMVRHYDSEQEAYATRHQLWEQRVQRERDHPTPLGTVPLVDRYMFDLQGFFVVRVHRLPLR